MPVTSTGSSFALDALDVAMHARRLAEQHFHRHVDRLMRGGVVQFGVDQLQLTFGVAVPTTANGQRSRSHIASKAGEIGRRNGQHIALLRFVRPDLARRQTALFQLDLAQIEQRALARAVHHFRERVRQTARADVVNAQDRVLVAELPARVDHFLRATLDFRIAALHRVEVEFGGVGAGRHRAGRAAAHADAHARAADLDQQRAFRQIVLVRVLIRDVADAAGDHDRLVIAAHETRDVLLVGAEIAAQVRPAEFVVERGAAERAVDHDLQRRRDAVRTAIRFVLVGRIAVRERLRARRARFPMPRRRPAVRGSTP